VFGILLSLFIDQIVLSNTLTALFVFSMAGIVFLNLCSIAYYYLGKYSLSKAVRLDCRIINNNEIKFHTDIFGFIEPNFVREVAPEPYGAKIDNLMFRRRFCFVIFAIMIANFLFFAPLWFMSTFVVLSM
jgi:hypothetical protein